MIHKLGFAALAALSSVQLGLAAEQETFTRPNAAEECGAQVNYLSYAQSLGEVVQCTGPVCDYQEQAGLFFDLQYRQNYKVVKYNQIDVDVTYVLYTCGTAKPDDAFIKGLNKTTTAFIEIPVTAVATSDSTAAWMLEELGVEDRVRYASSFSTAPCMLKIALPGADGGCNRAFATDPVTFENLINQTEYDVEFAFGSSDSTAAKQVAFRVSSDPGPLRRAEHIVYMSAFFNLEAQALEYYREVEAAYEALVVTPGPNAPVMAWVDYTASNAFEVNPDGETLNGTVYKVSLAPYKVTYTGDAGAKALEQADIVTAPAFASFSDAVIFAESEYPTLQACQNAVKNVLKTVDILIDESFTAEKNLTKFLSEWGIKPAEQADMPFLVSDNLWAHDKDRAVTGSDDWFGEAVARPDMVLLDLRAIVAPGQYANHTSVFFRNIALNENSTSFGPEACMDVECSAYANQEALPSAADAVAVSPVASPPAAVAPTPVVSAPVAAAPVPAEGEVEGAVPAESEEGGAVPAEGEEGTVAASSAAPLSALAAVSGIAVAVIALL